MNKSKDLIWLLSSGLIFVLIFLVSYAAVKLMKTKKTKGFKQPPCLPRFPILGSLTFLPSFGEMHKYFFEKSKELGNVLAFYMCNQYAIVLNGRETIHEALVRQSLAFSDRPLFILSYIHNRNSKGIIMHPYNEHFKKFHRLSLTILKKLGFGQGVMEARIRLDVDCLLEKIAQNRGQALNPAAYITSSVANVICSIVFGQRWESDDPVFEEIIDLIRTLIRKLEEPVTINFFPVIRFLPKYRRVIEDQTIIYARMKEAINGIIKELDGDETNECFYCSFKRAMQNEVDAGSMSEIDDDQLYVTIRDLFIAGTDTTATTLQWFVILMANHQDVQVLIRDEMDRIVGRERNPGLNDKSELPLFEATLLEVMRFKTLVPLALPHLTTKDTFINGMFIPRRTLVFPNIFSCHMDPHTWHEPTKFNINRFLDERKTKVINKEFVIPFSIGKRSCLGEILARQELFLFASALVHEFEIRPDEGENYIEVTENVAVTNTPSAFKARFIRRQP